MKIRNRILAGLLSFTVVMGELLPVYAEGTDTEYAAEEAAVTGEAGDGTDTEPADEEGAEEDLSKETDAPGAYAFVPGYIELPEDEEVTILNTDKSYRELRSALVEGDAEEEYYYSAEADRASATDRAFPYSYTKEASITDYFNTYFPPARNQNPFGSCWAHSAMSLGEFYLASHGKLSDRTAVDFSELHMAWFCYTQGTPSLAGDSGDQVSFYYSSVNEKLNRGGNLRFAAQTLAQGRGFVDESVAPYPEYEGTYYQDVSVMTPAESTERRDSAYLTCSYEISTEDVEQLKQAVISNGIVGVSLFWDDTYYNSEYNSYICTDRTKTNHAVCIVGWDDDFPAAAFGGQASRNGAWLIRNSWNFFGEMDTLSSYCYFWLSYDDTSLSDIAWVFEADTESYDNHYFYDSEPHGENAFGYGEGANCYSANVYQAQGNEGGSELLEAVGFSARAISASGTDYELQVYTGLAPGGDPSTGTLHEASVTGGTIYFNGYYTVQLKEAVPLEEGEYYAVVLKRTDGYSATVEGATYMDNGFSAVPGAQSGQSFYSSNARSWTDSHSTGKYNFVLGAYTTNVSGSGDRSSLKLNPASLALEIGESGAVTATVKDHEGNIDGSAEVSFESSDSTVASVTAEGQSATVTALKSGKATITASCGSRTAKCQVTVRAKEEQIPATIVLSKTALSFTAADQTAKLSATVWDTNSRVITDPQLVFESQDSGVATVDEDGTVRPVATGATSIIVNCGNAYASCSVSVALSGMRTAAPVADPESGSDLAVGDMIRLSCATEGAKIYYTTDGTTPTESSTLYENAIVVPESASGKSFKVIAMAVAEGYTASSVEEFRYTVAEDVPAEQTAAPVADPKDGSTLKVGDQIHLSSATEGAKILYTTDGTKVTKESALYTEAITVEKEQAGKRFLVRAFAVCEDLEDSAEVSFNYTVSDLSAILLNRESVRITSTEEQIRLKATVMGPDGKADEDAVIVFESLNPSVVAVSEDGLLTARSNGSGIVTASCGKLSAQCKVTVRLQDPEEIVPVYNLDFYLEEVLQSSLSVERGQYADAEDIPLVEGLLFWFDREVGEVWDPTSPVTRDMQLHACFEGDTAPGRSALDMIPVRTGDSYYLVRGQSLELGTEGNPVLLYDNGTVKLSKKGVITAKKAGTERVLLSGEEYNLYVIEPVICANDQAVKSMALIPGASQKLDVRRMGSDGKNLAEQYPVYWYSSAPAVVSVSGGEVYAIAKGSATVTAYVNGKGYSCKVKVADTKKVTVYMEDYEWKHIELSTISLKPLQSYTLKYQGLSFKNREWESEDSDLRKENEGKKSVYENDVVRIDQNGKITAIGPGSCTISFTDGDDTEYSLRVSVSQPQERRLYLNSGKGCTLKFYGVKNGAAKFETSDSYVATVDAKGYVKGHRAGMAIISCAYGNFEFVTRVYTEYAMLDTQSSNLWQNGNQYSYKLRIKVGAAQRLRFRTEKGYGVCQPVLFKSNRNNIAFVDENGRIEARNTGNAVITAKVNGKKITIKVTVTP